MIYMKSNKISRGGRKAGPLDQGGRVMTLTSVLVGLIAGWLAGIVMERGEGTGGSGT
jgi:hypothetical protein